MIGIVKSVLEEAALARQQANTAVLFVTHSVYESVFLGEQVLVLASNPGRVKEIVQTDLPPDRDLSIRETPQFVALAGRLRRSLGSAGHG
jgi:NitT/TauT family transport system ATP-binding protein